MVTSKILPHSISLPGASCFSQAQNALSKVTSNQAILVGERALTDQSSIGQALADYFREFYRRGSPNRWRWFANGVATISPDQQQELISPFTEEEVQVAIRGLNSEGALGPDGIPVFFYLDCWDVVGPEVLATIEEFRAGRCNMERLNRATSFFSRKLKVLSELGTSDLVRCRTLFT